MSILACSVRELAFSDRDSLEAFLSTLRASQRVNYTQTPDGYKVRLIEMPLIDVLQIVFYSFAVIDVLLMAHLVATRTLSL